MTSTKLDLGCGKNKKEGFFGVDQYQMPGVDLVLDLGSDPWPFESDSIEEVHCSHFFEHLDPRGRIHFLNELWRVMKVDAKALIIVPYWASGRAYGDLSHAWPPVSEMSFYYFDQNWRAQNAPHLDKQFNSGGLDCHFIFTCGYALNQKIVNRNLEFQQLLIEFCKEAAQDIIATLTKSPRPPPA
jgi:hypothetical protein